MKITKIIMRILIGLPLISISSCYYDEALEEEPIAEDIIISFSADVQPILNSNCASCHPLLVKTLDLTSGNSYNSISDGTYVAPKNLDNSILYQRLLGNPSIMPPQGALPNSDIEVIKRWIEQGASNN